jgi:GMP synthase-like glutamine amidotransferase
VIQHVEPEPPYKIGEALRSAGVDLDHRRIFAGDDVPSDCTGYSGVVVMGGPMSAHLDDGFPSRLAEISALESALSLEIPTLGVCLGAQLLAIASGADVYPGTSGAEIGWAPIELSDAAADDRLLHGLPSTLNVLHWHGDTFDIPDGAVHLASSARYPNQGFRSGHAAWGLQFHLEVDQTALDTFLSDFGEDASAAEGGAAAIAGETPGALAALDPHRGIVLQRFAALVVAADESARLAGSPTAV